MPVWKPEKSPVWEVLNKSKPKSASGSFVQNVVREVRLMEAERKEVPLLFRWLQDNPGGALAATAAALLVLSMAIPYFKPLSSPSTGELAANPDSSLVEPGDLEVVSVPFEEVAVDALAEEFEMMGLVDEMLAMNDPSLLDDEALAELLF